jgi:hypothetical protein
LTPFNSTPQTPAGRAALLSSCRRFLEVLAGGNAASMDGDGGGGRVAGVKASTWRWDGDDGDDGDGGDGGDANGNANGKRLRDASGAAR